MKIDWGMNISQLPNHASPSLRSPILPRSLSQHLSQSLNLMHFNQHVYLVLRPSAPTPPLTLHQWHLSHKQQENISTHLLHLQLHVPFLNQYLPSADKLYNFLTIRGCDADIFTFYLLFFLATHSLFLWCGYYLSEGDGWPWSGEQYHLHQNNWYWKMATTFLMTAQQNHIHPTNTQNFYNVKTLRYCNRHRC